MSCPFDAIRLGDGHTRYEMCTHRGFPLWTVDAEHCHSREDALSWIVADQIGRRNLTPSQKGPIGIKLKKQLAIEAKKLQATSTGGSKPQLQERFPEADKGQARDHAAKMVGANPHYVTDAKKIEQDAPVKYS